MHNLIDNSANRRVTFCNFNQHINAFHADRVMEEHDLIYIQEGQWDIAQDGVAYTVSPGDVILLHDLSDSSVDAALAIIDRLQEEGFTFLTVSQLAALRGIEPEPGKVYQSFPADS